MLLVEQPPQFLRERVPDGRVAEEAGDADQHLAKERLNLSWVLAQDAQILGEAADLVDPHAPLDPPVARFRLVQREVAAGALAQQGEDLLEEGRALPHRHRLGQARPAHVGHQPLRHRARLQHEVDETAHDRASGHTRMPRRRLVLGEREAGVALDRREPERPVGSRARQDDTDSVLLLVLGQRAEKGVDRHGRAGVAHGADEVERASVDLEVLARRSDADGVPLDPRALRGLAHRHHRVSPEELGQHARMLGSLVRHHDERHPGVGRGPGEKLLERLEAARGCAEADDQESVLPGPPRQRRPWRGLAGLAGRPVGSGAPLRPLHHCHVRVTLRLGRS